jgi:hypothetical protein
VEEAKDRTDEQIRTINEYLELRRDTIAVKSYIAILEIGLNLPDEAVRHPVVNKLSTLAAEMILLDNVSRDATTHGEVNGHRRTWSHTT